MKLDGVGLCESFTQVVCEFKWILDDERGALERADVIALFLRSSSQVYGVTGREDLIERTVDGNDLLRRPPLRVELEEV